MTDKIKLIIAFLLVVYVALLGFGISHNLVPCLTNKRTLLVERSSPFGTIEIDHVIYKVPWKKEVSLVPVKASNLLDVLFLSNSEEQQSLLGTIIQLALCLLTELCLINILIGRPAVPGQMYGLIVKLLVLYIIAEFAKNITTHAWVSDTNNKLTGLHNVDYHTEIQLFLIPAISLMIVLFFKKAPLQSGIGR